VEDKTFEMIEKLYGRMEQGFQAMNMRMDTIESKMATKQDLARIEQTIGGKIDALFDGYKANTEAIHDLKTELQIVKKEVENHEIKLKVVK